MKLNLTILSILLCCNAMAQQKFIEVTVSDTVLVKADLFVYKIALAPDREYSEVDTTPRSPQLLEAMIQQRLQNSRRSFDSLRSALSAGGFVLYKSSLEDSFNIIQSDVYYFSMRIMTHSADSLAMLYRRLRDVKGLAGYLELAVAAHDSSYQKKLFKKILGMARIKAETIAAYSDQRVRGVLAVTENKADGGETGGWTSYPPLSALTESVIPGWHTTIRPANIIPASSAMGWYPLAGTLTVRFGIE